MKALSDTNKTNIKRKEKWRFNAEADNYKIVHYWLKEVNLGQKQTMHEKKEKESIADDQANKKKYRKRSTGKDRNQKDTDQKRRYILKQKVG